MAIFDSTTLNDRLAGTRAPWLSDFMRVVSRIVTGASPASRKSIRQAAPFPTDNWLREDVGLPPIAGDQPTVQQPLTFRAAAHFPTDDRLRDDIGLPPICLPGLFARP